MMTKRLDSWRAPIASQQIGAFAEPWPGCCPRIYINPQLDTSQLQLCSDGRTATVRARLGPCHLISDIGAMVGQLKLEGQRPQDGVGGQPLQF